MTVLSWQLDLEGLAATAGRCERFEAFFDPQSDGIPMTTTRLPADDGSLVYQQTMELAGVQNSIYMAFANVGPKAVFGIVFPTDESDDRGQSDAAANLYRHRRPSDRAHPGGLTDLFMSPPKSAPQRCAGL